MPQIIIVEDSSRHDLGGGQRITLQTIDCLKSNINYDISLYDVGCGLEFSTEVIKKNITYKFYGLKNTLHFFYKSPVIIADILRAVKPDNKVYLYPTTKKALMVSVAAKLLFINAVIIFHQHSNLGMMFNWLKLFARRVIIPGAIADTYNNKTIVISNPIKISRTKVKCKQNNLGKTILGFIGNLSTIKGFDIFVESQKESIVHTLIAGIGPLKYLVSKNTNYLGYIDQETKEKFYMDIDVLVFPSVVEETFSLVCFEALFNYNPIVCFDIGYPAKIVKKYNVGVIAKSFTPESLNLAIQECSKNIEQLSYNCNKIIEDFEDDEFCSKFMTIFN